TSRTPEPRETIDRVVWHTDDLFQESVQEIPVRNKRVMLRVRSRRWVPQRLLRDEPSAGAKQAGDAAQGLPGVGLMHEKEPRVGQVEWAAQCRHVEVMDVAAEQLHIVQSERGRDRPGPLYSRLVEVDPNHGSRRADH